MDCSSLSSPSSLGIFGTMVGTVLGFFLQRITRIGRLKIFQNKLTFQLFERLKDSGPTFSKVTTIEEGEDFYTEIELFCDFFNTSESNNKIARDIYFEAKSKQVHIKETIFIMEVNNKYEPSTLQNLNLNPRQLINYHLSVKIENQQIDFDNSTLFIKYRNSRNRLKKIKIIKKMLTS